MDSKALESLRHCSLWEFSRSRRQLFALPQGIEAPFDIQLNRVWSFPKTVHLLSERLAVAARKGRPTHIGGAIGPALPWAALVAQALKLPLLIIEDGSVHGTFQKYDPVVLIERRMGQPKTLEPLVEAIVSVHLTPAAIVTLLDDEEEGSEAYFRRSRWLKKYRMSSASLFSFTDLIRASDRSGELPAELVSLMTQFLLDPQGSMNNRLLWMKWGEVVEQHLHQGGEGG
jgi:orotate phosphoribosyltransferase